MPNRDHFDGVELYLGTRRILFVILAVLVVATGGVYAFFAHEEACARARLAGRSETIETSFGTLEYAVMGEGEPVLVVHGAGGGFDQGIDMTGTLAGRGYHLIAPSRFGYLRSTLPGNLSTAMQADAYAQLLDRLRVDKVVVVGISAGAWSIKAIPAAALALDRNMVGMAQSGAFAAFTPTFISTSASSTPTTVSRGAAPDKSNARGKTWKDYMPCPLQCSVGMTCPGDHA